MRTKVLVNSRREGAILAAPAARVDLSGGIMGPEKTIALVLEISVKKNC